MKIYTIILSVLFSLNLYSQIGPDGTGTVNGYYIGPDSDLFFADLTGADLTGADLSYTNAIGANLTGANLSGADLSGTDLTGADFTGVISGNITGTPTLPYNYKIINGYIVGQDVDLTGADLSGVVILLNGTGSITGANLSGADLTGADLSDQFMDLTGVKSGNITGTPTLPSGYQMAGGYIVGPSVDLTGADLTGVDLSGADLTGVISGNITGTPTLPSAYLMAGGYIVGPGNFIVFSNKYAPI